MRRRRGLHRNFQRRIAAGEHVRRQEDQHEQQAELRHRARDRAEKYAGGAGKDLDAARPPAR